PYLGSRMSTADFALVVHSLPRGCVQLGSATAGNGNQACALPAVLTISTRVVTSNLRQLSGRGVNGSSAHAPGGNATAAASAAPSLKNSRLNMPNLPFLKMDTRTVQPGTSMSRSVRIFVTSGRAQSTSPSAMKRGFSPPSSTTVEGSV